ncbi:uncharacterized protein LOC129585187 [Paramacrobiotus metropolitanus]|uniref:uncharacterized protein LOC129585187 n=1 Tax=Paramacrobiotus metropolitanus TaxID=2943436 RepID=UPI0024462E22|nr:uncharacterized protein LOC129585187 [Paramacrobiotus metropolitanus]
MHYRLILLLAVTCTSTANRVLSQGTPDLSAPAFTLPYQSYHIEIYPAFNNGSTPVYYYMPACVFLPNATVFSPRNTLPRSVTLKIRLWNEDYVNHIHTLLSQHTGSSNIQLRPVPFKWMRVVSIGNWPGSHIGPSWNSIAQFPQTVTFNIACTTAAACEQIERSLTNTERFAFNAHVTFGYRVPSVAEKNFTIHLASTSMLRAIKERFPDSENVFIQKADFYDLVRETVTKCLNSQLSGNELVTDDQVDDLVEEVAESFRRNVTSTEDFTDAMWQSTFWKETVHRPDLKAKNLEILFSNGKYWIQKATKGDNVSGEIGSALAELTPSSGYVRWTGDRFVLDSVDLYCVPLAALRRQQNFGNFAAAVTLRIADYVTSLHLPHRAYEEAASRTVKFVMPPLSADSNCTTNDRQSATHHYIASEKNITITWLVRNGDTWEALTGFTVHVTKTNSITGKLDARFFITSNQSGEISLILSQSTNFIFTFEATGYYPVTANNLQRNLINGAVATAGYIEPLVLISKQYSGSGIVKGTLSSVPGVKNTRSYESLADAVVEFRSGLDNVTGTPTISLRTFTDGAWQASLPTGYYTLTASKVGFINATMNIIVISGKTLTYDTAIPPMPKSGEIRILLRGKHEHHSGVLDMTLHVRGPLAGKSDRSHVYWNSLNSPDNLVSHDVNTYVYRSTVIKQQLPGAYRIIVQNYFKGASYPNAISGLANSRAVVEVYRDTGLWGQFFVPNRMRNAWNVVEINGNLITPLNEMKTVAAEQDLS